MRHLKQNWQTYLIIVTTLFGLGVSWGALSRKVDYTNEKVDGLDSRMVRIEDILMAPGRVSVR